MYADHTCYTQMYSMLLDWVFNTSYVQIQLKLWCMEAFLFCWPKNATNAQKDSITIKAAAGD